VDLGRIQAVGRGLQTIRETGVVTMNPFDPSEDAESIRELPTEATEAAGDGHDALAGLDAGALTSTLAEIRDRAATPVGPEAGFQELREEIAGLKRLFEQKILRDQGLQGIINRLHESLQDAQADLALKFLRPILLELIRLHDALAAGAAADGPAARTLDQFRQDVEDLLYRQGAEPYVCPGDRVDPARQRVKRTRPADHPDDAGLVVERLRPGFRYLEKLILRPEEVVALAKPTTQPNERKGGTHP
jgi:molecular chaperone GrpE (heat shock protein)